jgi:digeranylgeranylglycerophospholipid reductase
MRESVDVLIVGAGPAGSVAAKRAAEAGLDTLLIEKRQEIGVPVRCAEAVGAVGTSEFIDEDPRWINAYIDFYSISNRQGERVTVPPTEPTWVVDRKVFDYELAHLANNAGATVLTSAAATALLREDGRVSGVTIKRFGKLTDVKAKLVIAADGVESQVARWAGLKTVPPMGDFYTGAQYLLGNMAGHIQPNRCEYHVGMDMAPGGYLWVFPKGKDTANVGIVISADRAAEVSAREYLDRFVEARFPGTSILNVVVGGIPATGALKKMVTDGLMVIGDAAHQADPLTAGGINLGMYGGAMAMQVGIEALKQGDVSAAALQPYEELWRDRFGKMHAALYKLRKMMTQMNPDTLDGIIRTAATLPLDTMTPGAVLMTLLREHPRMLFEARTLITTGLILK